MTAENVSPEPDGEATEDRHCPVYPAEVWLRSLGSGALVRPRCGRLACWYCLPINAARRSAAIGLAGPERMFTLTQVGDSWQEIRPRINRFTYALRQMGFVLETVVNVEENPADTGNHAHVWQRGGYLPQKVLVGVAVTQGFGPVVDIRKWEDRGRSGYGLKTVAYGLKAIEGQESAGRFLELNGRRLSHQSRGFFRSASGERLPVRKAEQEAMRDQGGDPGPWEMITL